MSSERAYSLPVSGESICPYCGVGCRLSFDGEAGPGGTSLKVRGVADAPANLGRLCAKGALLGETIGTHDRLSVPLLRASRHEPFHASTCDEALGRVAARFRRLID